MFVTTERLASTPATIPEVKLMDAALGAEISGIDASVPLDDAATDLIRATLLSHQVVVLRDQTLTPSQLHRFAAHFGDIDTYPFAEHIPGHPGVVAVTKEPSTELNFGGVWHHDSPYLAHPPKGTVLYGVDIPETGGDTMFANMYAAYDALPVDLRTLLSGRRGAFSACCVQLNDELKLGDVVRRRNDALAMEEQLHPIIRTHPETGRKAVFVSRVHVQRIEGMAEAESTRILDDLAEFVVAPRFTMRLKWRPGTLVIWDNRCVQHYAINDYPNVRREVHRVVLKGDRPI